MPLWTQNLVVLIAVVACLAIVGRQALASLRGKKSRLGNCCSRGCASADAPKSNATQFISADSLRLKRR